MKNEDKPINSGSIFKHTGIRFMPDIIKQMDNLQKIEELTVQLNKALNNIDGPTRTQLEAHNLQVSGISLSLLRVQIGIDNTLNDLQVKSTTQKKPVISRVG